MSKMDFPDIDLPTCITPDQEKSKDENLCDTEETKSSEQDTEEIVEEDPTTPSSPASITSETIDRGEEADGESDMENQQAEENVVATGETGKKRKKQDPNKRRKIRKMLTEDKLNKETLLAVQEEQQRRKRIEEQAQQRAQMQADATAKQEQPMIPSSTAQSSFLAQLLTASDRPPGLSSFTAAVKSPAAQKAEDVITISSDESDIESSKPTDAIDVSSDNSDDVICTGEVKDEDPGMEEVNNSGMHSDDTLNQPDAQGRVLVNVNRPSNEPEIFLAPQLSKAVLPHQIGGIRFMFDNLVETLSHYETSSGFGCILAHAMGLGKTLQVISFVDVFLRFTKARTVLCVVPVNTLMNWVAEFDMWLPLKSKCVNENPALVWPRSFSVHVLTESHKTVESRSKVVTQWYEEGGMLLVGYEMYRLLASRKSRKRRSKKTKTELPSVVDLDEQGRISSLQSGMQDSLLKPGPDLIICDEGHRIKNSHANISKVLKDVRTKRRLVLTGYPLQNNLMEYWCMVDFVRPSFLGTKQEFSNMFERPILNGQCADSTKDDIRLMRFRSHVLHSLLKGFVQRRSHSVLRNNLPLKEEHVLMIRMSAWQKKLYNTFISRNMEGASGSWGSTVNPIRAFSICCKIWNHPDVLYRTVQEKTDKQDDLDFDLSDPLPNTNTNGSQASNKSPSNSQESVTGASAASSPAPSSFSEDKEKGFNYDWAKDLLTNYQAGFVELSGKMVILMQMIRASVASGDRLLVFSQSLNTLTLIEEFLSKFQVPRPDQEPRPWCKNRSYFRLDGNTHSADRERMINQFNSPDNKDVWLFLLSTRAGCLGINLIGANRVIVFDASWNPCHDAQAVCRVYRYGQQKDCHIYRLVCDQSMEKKIYERQVSKQGMSDRVVDKLNPTSVFTKQEVLKLLEYSNDELARVDFNDVEEYIDPVLRETCTMSGHWLTRRPFQHESLLLDCKDQRLTKAEKRMAHKGYQRDKMASSTYNYSRPSYAGFYNGATGAGALPKSASTNTMLSRPIFPSNLPHDGARPIANVRPMQSTPLPMQLKSGAMSRQTGSPYYHRAGVSVQKIVATQEIPLPPIQSSSVNSVSGSNAPGSIKVGETYCVIRGRKGTYIRTLTGRVFAVRSNETARLDTQSVTSQSTASNGPTPSPNEVNFRRNRSEPVLRRTTPATVSHSSSTQGVFPSSLGASPYMFQSVPPMHHTGGSAPLLTTKSSAPVSSQSSNPIALTTHVTNSSGLLMSSGESFGSANSFNNFRNRMTAQMPNFAAERNGSESPQSFIDQLLNPVVSRDASPANHSASLPANLMDYNKEVSSNHEFPFTQPSAAVPPTNQMPFSNFQTDFDNFSNFTPSTFGLPLTSTYPTVDDISTTMRNEPNPLGQSLEDSGLLDLSQKAATFHLGY
uniref:Helicase ARIP4-like n=1 Tax=Phallusia mammillata TaxID=59560 RepID=A0A6F9DQL5_9ASCI|nr:helicase ARIP4-like [Phallusia mammillata]